MRERVLLGFSGGIDSVSAVGLLREQGFDVVALTLDMTGDESLLLRAANVASHMNLEHHILDVQEQFSKHIIDYFTESYLSGYTPAPCTVCNPLIKWRYIRQEADRLGIRCIASGHYFNVKNFDGKYYVCRAADLSKDQSYYLWGLEQDTLSRMVTPVGHHIKEALKANFLDKRESMGLCFLGGSLYRDFITSRHPHAAKRGDVVTISGEVIGSHDGIAFYTIGQKRGFECAIAGSVVVDIDAESNRLVVGCNDDLYKSIIDISRCNIVDEQELLTSDDISVVVRGIGRNPEGYAKSVAKMSSGYRITLSNPAWAVALGQPVVLYRGERVIGGGFVVGRY